MSMAFVIGGRGAYPWLAWVEIVPEGVEGLVLGVGGVKTNDVCDAVDNVGDMAGENSPIREENTKELVRVNIQHFDTGV